MCSIYGPTSPITTRCSLQYYPTSQPQPTLRTHTHHPHRYQQLLDVLEENFPTHLPPANDLVDELELLLDCGVTGNLDEDDQTVEMVEKMKLAEKALQDEQAKAAVLVDGFKSRLDRESAKVTALNEENSMLRAENQAKSMTKQFELLQASLKAQLEQQQDEMLAAQLSMRGKGGGAKEMSLEDTLKEQAAKREEEAKAEDAKAKEVSNE